MPTSAKTPDQRSDRYLGTSKWAPRLLSRWVRPNDTTKTVSYMVSWRLCWTW
jgi:hypothetical protein